MTTEDELRTRLEAKSIVGLAGGIWIKTKRAQRIAIEHAEARVAEARSEMRERDGWHRVERDRLERWAVQLLDIQQRLGVAESACADRMGDLTEIDCLRHHLGEITAAAAHYRQVSAAEWATGDRLLKYLFRTGDFDSAESLRLKRDAEHALLRYEEALDGLLGVIAAASVSVPGLVVGEDPVSPVPPAASPEQDLTWYRAELDACRSAIARHEADCEAWLDAEGELRTVVALARRWAEADDTSYEVDMRRMSSTDPGLCSPPSTAWSELLAAKVALKAALR